MYLQLGSLLIQFRQAGTASGAACTRLGLGLPLLGDLGEVHGQALLLQEPLQLWHPLHRLCTHGGILPAVQLLQLPVAVLRTGEATSAAVGHQRSPRQPLELRMCTVWCCIY